MMAPAQITPLALAAAVMVCKTSPFGGAIRLRDDQKQAYAELRRGRPTRSPCN